ncbi:hypothetical protein B0H14DRAFT_3735241 [Mycena olivaceomarginata]|nr:hypothetical protein B0H14DRAFT_3735241 [Mycena olivaceomarginata]
MNRLSVLCTPRPSRELCYPAAPPPHHRVVAVKPAPSRASACNALRTFLLLSTHVEFGNWAVQRCLEAATGPEERRKIVACMQYVICPLLSSSRIIEFAKNCYGYYVLQKALDCKEEEVCLMMVSELLQSDPATTLVNKHASHVWNHGALVGPTGAADLRVVVRQSLVVQHTFENWGTAKDGIIDELLDHVENLKIVLQEPGIGPSQCRQRREQYGVPGVEMRIHMLARTSSAINMTRTRWEYRHALGVACRRCGFQGADGCAFKLLLREGLWHLQRATYDIVKRKFSVVNRTEVVRIWSLQSLEN